MVKKNGKIDLHGGKNMKNLIRYSTLGPVFHVVWLWQRILISVHPYIVYKIYMYKNKFFKHLHLVILQMLLSTATYNWGIHKAIHLEEANNY